MFTTCTFVTAILIIFEGQFQVFQRFSSSKLVLKPLKAVSQPSIIMRMAVCAISSTNMRCSCACMCEYLYVCERYGLMFADEFPAEVVCMYTCMYVCMYVIQCMHACMTCVSTTLYECMYVCDSMYVCMYVCDSMYVCMYVCNAHLCMYVSDSMYVCMRACMPCLNTALFPYIHIYTYTCARVHNCREAYFS